LNYLFEPFYQTELFTVVDLKATFIECLRLSSERFANDLNVEIINNILAAKNLEIVLFLMQIWASPFKLHNEEQTNGIMDLLSQLYQSDFQNKDMIIKTASIITLLLSPMIVQYKDLFKERNDASTDLLQPQLMENSALIFAELCQSDCHIDPLELTIMFLKAGDSVAFQPHNYSNL
jgi:hypothetical protein